MERKYKAKIRSNTGYVFYVDVYASDYESAFLKAEKLVKSNARIGVKQNIRFILCGLEAA